MDAVVKVYCVHTEPNYSLPWQRKRQYASTSTGFMVSCQREGERWLLTNAHSVEYHSQVRRGAALSGKIFDSAFYRHGVGFRSGRRQMCGCLGMRTRRGMPQPGEGTLAVIW